MLELKSLKTLVPQKGRAWFIREGYVLDLFTGLSLSIEEVRLWFESVLENIFPSTVLDSLDDWYNDYGMIYDSTQSITEQRNKLISKVYQLGASDKGYIISIIRKLGLENIIIIEGITSPDNVCGDTVCGDTVCEGLFTPWGIYDDYYNYYLVFGTVDTPGEFDSLKATLQEVVNARLIPIYVVTIGDVDNDVWDDNNFWMDGKIWEDLP